MLTLGTSFVPSLIGHLASVDVKQHERNVFRVSRFGLAVSGRTSVLYRFGSHFSSKRLWFVDTVLWLCPSLPTETLKWLSSLPILMQETFWWWQCSDRYIISLSPHLHTPFPPFSPSLISLMVSVDVKHHVYFTSFVSYMHWPSVCWNRLECVFLVHYRVLKPTGAFLGQQCTGRSWAWVLLYVHRNCRIIRDGSPGRPPRLSHCSWTLLAVSK